MASDRLSNRYHAWAFILLAVILPGFGFFTGADATESPLNFTIHNNSGFEESRIHLLCTGSNQAAPDAIRHFGYLDFRTGLFVETGTAADFRLDAATMTTTLETIRKNSQTNTITFSIPRMVSGRLYFAFGDNFDVCPDFTASGPSNGRANPVIYDKLEFDTWTTPNINITNVDFFGVSYYIEATDSKTGKPARRGFETSRDAVFAAFQSNGSNEYRWYGNPKIFEALIVTRDPRDHVDQVRILAPKNAAYTDFASSLEYAPQKSAHFWDRYIIDHCWKPGRTFSFYSKFHKPSDPNSDQTPYYGRVSDDGKTLSIYTDPERTKPYAPVPSLPRPSNGNHLFPEHPSEWHQVNSEDPDHIDWGYLLGGQVGVDKGAGAHWAIDPVAMAVTTSIVRGVMHRDNGCESWTDPRNFYCGDTAIGTAEFPIYLYGKIIHDFSIENLSYALSYDDVYGTDPSVYFSGHPDVSLTFNPIRSTSQAHFSVSETGVWVNQAGGTYSFEVSQTGGDPVPWEASVISGADWLQITSGEKGAGTGTLSCTYDANPALSRTAVIRVTASQAIGTPVDICITQMPETTPCTASLAINSLSDICLHIPVMRHSDPETGKAAFWMDLRYTFHESYPSLLLFQYQRYNVLRNPPVSGSISHLSDDYTMDVPDCLLWDQYTHLWLDLEWIPALSTDDRIVFLVTDFG